MRDRDDRSADSVNLYQQLSFSLTEHRKKIGHDLMIMQEMILQLMKVILMRTNVMSEKEKDSSEKQANARLDRIMEDVIRSLPKVNSNVTS